MALALTIDHQGLEESVLPRGPSRRPTSRVLTSAFAVRRWTRQHDHNLVKLFIEKAVPGTVAGDERPELGAVLSWIEDKKVHGIVAPNLDRLARELVVQEAALAQTRKHGGRAFMADQGEILPDDPEDPMRTAMRQMMGVFAQLDRGMTVAKLRRGRRIKGEKGEYA